MIIKDPFAKTTPLSWQTTPGEFKKRLSQNLKTVRVLPRYLYRVSGKWVSKGETQRWPTHGVGTGNGPLEEAPVGENCQASLSPGECLGTVELAREIPHKPCEQQPPPLTRLTIDVPSSLQGYCLRPEVQKSFYVCIIIV